MNNIAIISSNLYLFTLLKQMMKFEINYYPIYCDDLLIKYALIIREFTDTQNLAADLKFKEQQIILITNNQYKLLNAQIELIKINYLIKPINPNILFQMIQQLINAKKQEVLIKLNNKFLFDFEKKRIIDQIKQVNIYLTEKETMILQYLIKNYKKAVTKQEFLNNIWQNQPGVETRTLENHIYRLRKKLNLNTNLVIIGENGYKLITNDLA